MDPDNFNPFNPLSEDGKARLARGLIIRTYAPPAPVLLKGQRVSGAYFVVAGALRVYSLAPNGTTASANTHRFQPARSSTCPASTLVINSA